MTDSAMNLIGSDIPEKWQQMLADLVTDPKELLEILRLDPQARPASAAAQEEFPLRVPRPFVARMRPGDWQDPLLRQVWPDREEERAADDLVQDPLQERSFRRAPGLLQKYQGRVLLTAAPHCAIHCRYCFRRHFDYAANSPSRAQWRESLAALRDDPAIHEAILSGGDPLALGDRQLDWLISALEEIPHLHTLRLHSRVPVVIPARMTPSLLERLARSRLRVVLVIHANHAQELDQVCQREFRQMAAHGITMLNQSVLLAGVNDSVEALEQLSRSLFDAAVLPYYLHVPDAVAGTAHFQLSRQRASALVAELRARLPGYLVPRLVQEEPGASAKTPIA